MEVVEMKMVNIMECKSVDCLNNDGNDCTKDAIVIGIAGMCEDEEYEDIEITEVGK
jgi:hypothetical protein